MILRRTVAGLTVALAVLGLPTAPAAAAPRSPGGDINARGFEQLNACLSSGERVDALYVVDVSGSLVTNDPDGRRFEALEASVAQLGVLASGSAGLEVDAALSTFGDSFSGVDTVQDWAPVDAQSASDVAKRFREQAESAWTAAGTAQGTNYEAALDGAQRTLSARGATSDACQIVFWFTDGLFALGDTYDEAATNAAGRRMCRPGGVVDRLRNQQTTVIALALTGPDVDAQLARPEYATRRGELQAMAVGKAGRRTCGTAPVPADARPGIYLAVDDPVGLGGLFSGVAAQAAGCAPETLRATSPARFAVERGVGRFQVDTTGEGIAGEVLVTAPGGASARFGPGSGKLGGAAVRVARTGSLLTVGVTLDPAARASAGTWSVDAGGGTSAITLYRCSDLRIVVADPEQQLTGGEPASVDATVVGPDDEPADLTAYADLDPGSENLTVATSPDSRVDVSVADAATGQLEVELTPPDDVTAVDLSLALLPRLAAAPDIELGAVSTTRRLPVTPPGSFPSVRPVELDLGRAVGLEAARQTLEVVGSSEGNSRVCFAPAVDIDAPADSGDNRITAPAECLDLAADETAAVDVSVTPAVSVDGEGQATLPVTLVNADGDEVSQDVALSWELERPIDQGTRLWVLLAAMIASLLALVVALVLVNRWLARFREGDPRFLTLPAEIDEDGRVRVLEDVGERRPDYLLVDRHERRRLHDPSGSGIELRATAPWTLGDPEFLAHAAHGTRLVPADGHVTGEGRTSSVTAGLGAGWLLQVADADLVQGIEDGPTPARLVVHGRGDLPVLQRMVIRCQHAVAENGWPQVRQQLAAAAATATREPQAMAGAVAGTTGSVAAGSYDDDPFGGATAWDAPDESRPTSSDRGRNPSRRTKRRPERRDTDERGHDLAPDDDPFA